MAQQQIVVGKPPCDRGNRILQCLPCGFLGDKHEVYSHYVEAHLELEESPFYCKPCFIKIDEKTYISHKSKSVHRARCAVAGVSHGMGSNPFQITEDVHAVTLSQEKSAEFRREYTR